MLFRPDRAQRLASIADMLRTGEPSDELMTSIADVYNRVHSSRESRHIKALIEAGAWIDTALALLAIELPGWKLRRLAYDEGEWHCAISQERELPQWLDDAIETRHTDIAMAILKTVVEGLGASEPEQYGALRSAHKSLEAESLVCCDNFG